MQKLILTLVFSLFSIISHAAEKLLIEPDAGRAPLLAAIDGAASSVDLVIYGMTDEKFVKALIQEKNKGVNVNILLEPHPYKAEDENQFTIQQLQTAHIPLHYPKSDFKLTHQKTFLIDQRYAIVMTFNLTHSTFKNERNFALIIDDPAMVREINQVFLADWQHKNIAVNHPNLIWSPNNSREKILDFIKQADSEIKIYAQDISDYQMIGALAKAARAGKNVRIILSDFHDNKPNKKLAYLRRAGVTIHFSKNKLIHAKVIIVDRQRAILGSINLTRPSLNDNRELSVITREPMVIHQLIKTFDSDWREENSVIKPKELQRVSRLLLKEMRRWARELART